MQTSFDPDKLYDSLSDAQKALESGVKSFERDYEGRGIYYKCISLDDCEFEAVIQQNDGHWVIYIL